MYNCTRLLRRWWLSRSCCTTFKAEVMIALLVSFLSFSLASRTMADFNSLFFKYGSFLLVFHKAPFVKPPWVDCTPQIFQFVSYIEYLNWVGPSLIANWVEDLFGPVLAWVPIPDPSSLPPPPDNYLYNNILKIYKLINQIHIWLWHTHSNLLNSKVITHGIWAMIIIFFHNIHHLV